MYFSFFPCDSLSLNIYALFYSALMSVFLISVSPFLWWALIGEAMHIHPVRSSDHLCQNKDVRIQLQTRCIFIRIFMSFTFFFSVSLWLGVQGIARKTQRREEREGLETRAKWNIKDSIGFGFRAHNQFVPSNYFALYLSSRLLLQFTLLLLLPLSGLRNTKQKRYKNSL